MGNGALGPELVSFIPPAAVGVYVGMFVCGSGQQHDPRHFSPSGLVFPLLPQLSLAHPLAALTPLLTFRASWEMPPTTTSCCKDPVCSLLTLPALVPA